MPAPPGTEIGLTYDWSGAGPPPGVGDWLRTRTGRLYMITSARRVRSSVSPCRLAFRAVILEELPDEGCTIYPLVWNKRDRAR